MNAAFQGEADRRIHAAAKNFVVRPLLLEREFLRVDREGQVSAIPQATDKSRARSLPQRFNNRL